MLVWRAYLTRHIFLLWFFFLVICLFDWFHEVRSITTINSPLYRSLPVTLWIPFVFFSPHYIWWSLIYRNDSGNAFRVSMFEFLHRVINTEQFSEVFKLSSLPLHLSKAGISNWVSFSICQFFFSVFFVVLYPAGFWLIVVRDFLFFD